MTADLAHRVRVTAIRKRLRQLSTSGIDSSMPAQFVQRRSFLYRPGCRMLPTAGAAILASMLGAIR